MDGHLLNRIHEAVTIVTNAITESVDEVKASLVNTDRPTLPLNADEWEMRRVIGVAPPKGEGPWHFVATAGVYAWTPAGKEYTELQPVLIWARKREGAK